MLAATLAPCFLLVRNPNVDAGVAAYLVGGAACLLGLWRARVRRVPGVGFWGTMAVLQFLLAAEVPYGFRFQVTSWMRQLFAWLGTGLEKRLLQLGVIAAVGMLFMVAVLVVLFRQETPNSRRVAVFGLLVSLLAWSVEAVSLHQASPILYQHLGPLVLVAWAWVGAAVFTVVGALLALRGVP